MLTVHTPNLLTFTQTRTICIRPSEKPLADDADSLSPNPRVHLCLAPNRACKTPRPPKVGCYSPHYSVTILWSSLYLSRKIYTRKVVPSLFLLGVSASRGFTGVYSAFGTRHPPCVNWCKFSQKWRKFPSKSVNLRKGQCHSTAQPMCKTQKKVM